MTKSPVAFVHALHVRIRQMTERAEVGEIINRFDYIAVGDSDTGQLLSSSQILP